MAKILIVEDEIVSARDLEQILIGFHHEIIGIAMDAHAAIQHFEEQKPDIVFVDILLRGDRDGITLSAQLRDEAPDTKIVFVTSHADMETVSRASIVKPNGYIVKPFSEEAIFATLSIALADDRVTPQPIDLDALSQASNGWTRLPNRALERIKDYVRKNFDHDITLNELASIANMSESSFSRRFKSTVGISPYQYVLSERIAEAKRLLKGTDWALAEVAIAVGFSNQSHFATTFKKAVGITPMAYRRL